MRARSALSEITRCSKAKTVRMLPRRLYASFNIRIDAEFDPAHSSAAPDGTSQLAAASLPRAHPTVRRPGASLLFAVKRETVRVPGCLERRSSGRTGWDTVIEGAGITAHD